MKKTLTLLTLVAGMAFGYSQGTVNFNNNVAFATSAPVAANGKSDRFVYDSDNSTRLVGTNYFAQLYFAIGSGVAESSLVAVTPTAAFRTPTTSSPGTWSGGTRTLPGTSAGQTVTLQVRVWDGSLFSTYEQAAVGAVGKIGKSVTFDYVVPTTGAPPAAFFMEGLQSFTLVPVPEPSTYALGALGLGAVALVRRRLRK